MHATTLKTSLLLVCIIGLAAGSAAAQASFTDISSSCGIMYSGYSKRVWDVAIGDIHNNGRTDLYCMTHGILTRSSIIYESNSSLSLNNISSTVFGSAPSNGGGQGAFLTDLNGDGYLDLMTGSNDGIGSVFRNQGDGTFVGYTDFPSYDGHWTAREMSSGDMDGDGDQDVIYGIHHRTMRIALNNGSGVYTKQEISWINGEKPCGATLPIVADMDNDGDLDIISQYMSAYGTCSVSRTITVDFWQNNGSGVFTWVSDTHGLLGGQEECPLLVGDFDNDADLDIIQLQMKSNGPNRYYVNDGTGYFTEKSASRGLGPDSHNVPYTDWWCKGNVGDFDNDGDLDLAYWGHIWSNDGLGNFTVIDYEFTHRGRITGVGDLDGDGDL
ncbi:MAG: VCBS repeat-containing protein, partial [Candidatus Krumholzibacteria bacterium]|nr:VCBS repeat-containing protein [Candidatus Krumholzibacteria bacterium]